MPPLLISSRVSVATSYAVVVPSAFDNRSASDVVSSSQVTVAVTGTNCSFANSVANSLAPHCASLLLVPTYSGSKGIVIVVTSASDVVLINSSSPSWLSIIMVVGSLGVVVVSTRASGKIEELSIAAWTLVVGVSFAANPKGSLLSGKRFSRKVVKISNGFLVVVVVVVINGVVKAGVVFVVLVQAWSVPVHVEPRIGSVFCCVCALESNCTGRVNW